LLEEDSFLASGTVLPRTFPLELIISADMHDDDCLMNSPLDRTKNCHLSLPTKLYFCLAGIQWMAERKPWQEYAMPTAKYLGSRVNEDWAVLEVDSMSSHDSAENRRHCD
jgi:hypothetical protein